MVVAASGFSLSLFLQKDHEKACYSHVGLDMFGPCPPMQRKTKGKRKKLK